MAVRWRSDGPNFKHNTFKFLENPKYVLKFVHPITILNRISASKSNNDIAKLKIESDLFTYLECDVFSNEIR
jgi:hypothetical protein